MVSPPSCAMSSFVGMPSAGIDRVVASNGNQTDSGSKSEKWFALKFFLMF